jgi:hypothetical protein
VAEPLRGQVPFEPELRQVIAAEVAQLDVLEIVPNALGRIERGSLRWQMFELEARGAALRSTGVGEKRY